jgi:hypothetical protein
VADPFLSARKAASRCNPNPEEFAKTATPSPTSPPHTPCFNSPPALKSLKIRIILFLISWDIVYFVCRFPSKWPYKQFLPPITPPALHCPSSPTKKVKTQNGPRGLIRAARGGGHARTSQECAGSHLSACHTNHPARGRRCRLRHAQPGAAACGIGCRGPGIQTPAAGPRPGRHLPHVTVPPLEHHPWRDPRGQEGRHCRRQGAIDPKYRSLCSHTSLTHTIS